MLTHSAKLELSFHGMASDLYAHQSPRSFFKGSRTKKKIVKICQKVLIRRDPQSEHWTPLYFPQEALFMKLTICTSWKQLFSSSQGLRPLQRGPNFGEPEQAERPAWTITILPSHYEHEFHFLGGRFPSFLVPFPVIPWRLPLCFLLMCLFCF